MLSYKAFQNYGGKDKYGPGVNTRNKQRCRGAKEETNGADGSQSKEKHRLENEDTIKGGTLVSTLDWGIGTPRQDFDSPPTKHCHHQNRKWANYMLKEFKKAKPPTFDREMRKS